MSYTKFNVADELQKLAQGKRTKVDPEMLVYLSLDPHRGLQKKVAKAFGITED